MNSKGAPEYTHDAFLSYVTEADYDLARDLESFLERFHELPTPESFSLRPLSIWRDGSDVSLSEAGNHAGVAGWLEYYMAQCRYLILLWSKQSAQARWTRFELKWFLANRGPQSVLLAITDALDPRPNSRQLFTPEILRAGLTERPWYDFRGFHGERLAGVLRLRDFDEARVQLAADLNGYRPSDIQPLWWRNKVREQEERAEREERARRQIELAECDARLEAANGWYERAFTAFQHRRYGDASRCLVEALAIADPARVPDHYPKSLVNSGWAENSWAFLRYTLPLAPTLHAVGILEEARQGTGLEAVRLDEDPPMKGLAWMDYGRSVAILGDHSLKVYEHASGNLLSAIHPPPRAGPITAWACAKRGDRIVLGTKQGCIVTWSRAAGATVTSDTHAAAVTAAAISPDGARAVTGSDDGQIRLWSGFTDPDRGPRGTIVRQIDGEEISHVLFALRDTALLFVAGNKLTVKELSSGEETELREFITGNLANDDDGLTFAYSDWDIVHRSEIAHHEESVIYVGEHRGFVDQIEFAAGGERIFTRDSLGTTCAWVGRDEPLERGQSFMDMRFTQTFGRANRGSLLKNLEELGRVEIVAPHPDDPSRFLVRRNRAIAEGDLGFTFEPAAGWRHATRGVRRAVWLPSADGIVVGADDGSIAVLRLDADRSVDRVAMLDAAVGDVVVGHEGKEVAAAAEDGSVSVISLLEARVLATVRVSSVPFAVAFAGEADEEVAIGCEDGVIRIWRWRGSASPRRLGACAGSVRRMDVDGGGKVLVVGTESGALSAWDLREAMELWSTAELSQAEWAGSLQDISISPDSKLVAYGSSLGVVGCVDITTGGHVSSTPLRASVPGKPEQVTAVGVSDDNRTALAGLWDGTLCVVDLKLGRELFRFPAHTKVITSTAQAPLGGAVLTASLDDNPDNDFVRVWKLLDVKSLPPPKNEEDDWARAARAAFERQHGRSEPDVRAEAQPALRSDAESSVPALRAALLREPRSPQRNLELAMALIEAGYEEHAQDYLARVSRFGGAELIRNPLAQTLTARVLLEQEEVEEGVAWLLRAAAQREPSALMQLGFMHLQGETLEYDEAKGLAYLQESAELDDPIAAYNLGVYHEHFAGGVVRQTDWRLIALGEAAGDDPELKEAMRWYRRAAEQGYGPAKDAAERLASSGVEE